MTNNILSKIGSFFNRATGTTAPSPVAIQNIGLLSGPSATEAAQDSFTRTFSGPAYFPSGAVIRPGMGFIVGKIPVVPEAILREVYNAAGGDKIASKSEREKLAECLALEKKLDEQLVNFNFYSAADLRRSEQALAVESLLAGQQPPMVRGFQEVTASVVSLREGIHKAKRDNAKVIYEVTLPIVEKFAAAAKKLAIERDNVERQTHKERFADTAPFVASIHLVAVAYVGMALAYSPIRNFKLTGLMAAPNPDNLFSMWHSPTPAPIVATISDIQKRVRSVADEKGRPRLVAEDHAEQIARQNQLVEKLKANGLKAIEDARNHTARVEAEKEARRMDAADAIYKERQSMPAPAITQDSPLPPAK